MHKMGGGGDTIQDEAQTLSAQVRGRCLVITNWYLLTRNPNLQGPSSQPSSLCPQSQVLPPTLNLKP
jgi:hypothetical protein